MRPEDLISMLSGQPMGRYPTPVQPPNVPSLPLPDAGLGAPPMPPVAPPRMTPEMDISQMLMGTMPPEPKPPTKKEIIGNAIGDFLTAMGAGLANRGKRSQSTGAGAAMLAALQGPRQRQQQAMAQHQATAQNALKAVEARLAAMKEGRERAVSESTIGRNQSQNEYDQARIAGLAAPKPAPPPVPGRDIPLPPAVAQQRIDMQNATRPAPQPPQVIPGRDIPLPKDVEAQRERMNASRAQQNGLSPQQFAQVNVLARQFDNTPTVKNFNETVSRVETVKSILAKPALGGPGDLAIVYQFMKALDPNSVVRESEFDAAAKSGNIFAGAYAKYNGYLKPEGGFLPDNVKKNFFDILDAKLKVDSKQMRGIYKDYARRIDVLSKQPGTGSQYLTDYTSIFGDESAPQEKPNPFRKK